MTILVLAVSLRSVRGVIFPLVTAVSAIVIVFGFQGILGIVFDPSMISIPVFLSLEVSIGYSIHLFNFFKREFFKTGLRHHALVHALEETAWPLLFSALTTIAALVSFMLVPMRPLRWVGFSSACLVGVAWLLERLMDNLEGRVLNRPRITLAIFTLIMITCLIGITRLEISFDYRRTMGNDVPYIARLDYIGKTPVGSLYAYDVALEFDTPGAAKKLSLAKICFQHNTIMLKMTKYFMC